VRSESESSDRRLRVVTFATIFPNVSDPSHGIFVYQRAKHLAMRPGVEVIAIVPIPYFPRWLKTNRWRKYQDIPNLETLENMEVHHPRYFHLPKIWMPFHGLSMFLGCASTVRRLHKLRRIDVIDSHFVYPEGFAATLLGKLVQVCVMVSARGTDINVYPSLKLIRPMIRWTLTKANGIIAVSKALKQKMVELGIAEDKIQVIPNGVDATRFQPEGKEEARLHLSLRATDRTIVSVGALIPGKGHDLVIRATAGLLSEFAGIKLFILGDGPIRQELEDLVRHLKLTENVQIVGKRPNEELRHWFSAADASCLASAREGWPNVVTESLACGTPVVATRVGGIPEILCSEELGILVERSVEGIRAGVRDALLKNWNRGEIANRTRQRTWDVVANEIEEVMLALQSDTDRKD
jgi:teichuronic acid biosynthesis glycosyltransferase TuaC